MKVTVLLLRPVLLPQELTRQILNMLCLHLDYSRRGNRQRPLSMRTTIRIQVRSKRAYLFLAQSSAIRLGHHRHYNNNNQAHRYPKLSRISSVRPEASSTPTSLIHKQNPRSLHHLHHSHLRAHRLAHPETKRYAKSSSGDASRSPELNEVRAIITMAHQRTHFLPSRPTPDRDQARRPANVLVSSVLACF